METEERKEKFPCEDLELLLLFVGIQLDDSASKLITELFEEKLAQAKIKGRVDRSFDWEYWLRKHVTSCDVCRKNYETFLDSERLGNESLIKMADLNQNYLKIPENLLEK